MDSPTKPSRGSVVTLREITEATVATFLKMKVADGQDRFVASNAVSIAQAHFSKVAWFRGIYADDIPVGFIMLEDDSEKPEYYLWRMMIAGEYQKFGFGRAAIELLIKYVKKRPNATELLVSAVEEDGGPITFYESLGFIRTGEIEHGETMLSLNLTAEN